MTTVTVRSNIKSWAARYKNQLNQLYLFTAAQMQTNRGMLFLYSGNYNGHETWKAPRLRDGKPLRDRGTLQKSIGPITRAKTGIVKPSWNEGTIIRFSGDTVTIGTSLKKAEILNKGGTILPKKGRFLWIPLTGNKKSQTEEVAAAMKEHKKTGKASLGHAPIVRLKNGKFFMLAKKVVIPPRRFDIFNQNDKDELTAALTNETARVLNKE